MVDCGGTPENTMAQLKRLDFRPDYLLLTHGHIDHIASLQAVSALGAQIIIHPDDAHYLTDPDFNLSTMLIGKEFMFAGAVSDGAFLESEFNIKMLHTPGHSPGSVCYLTEDTLFSGDTLFCNGIGNTAFPGGDYDREIYSVKQLLQLDGNIQVYPGHGKFTTIFAERNTL